MITWGIIGCGNVTEVKSGPAFNKVPNSKLHAVMRRDADKAADYALRHNVQKWFNDADALINDSDVNAIYIATPPSTHEEYAIASIKAGKHVYVEKPVTPDAAAARRIAEFAKANNIKMAVAHYRRQMPIFKKIKQLLDDNVIGQVLSINMNFFQAGKKETTENWRLDPAVSGGGYFHDLAPHQLDLMLYFFKPPVYVNGVSLNQGQHYAADDAVACTMLFENGAVFNGTWLFSAPESLERDSCEIIGTKGVITFSVFDMKQIAVNGEVIPFKPLQHVQQPMIEKVVEFFSGSASNPCSGDDGYTVMWMIDQITGRR
ncbi:MAG: Gfo/Idh/MocA family oxidoreductase [Moraxellaceae bacterium]|nr:MAG: Gfo/Idh/MocA family oxidoreductase [Moraxellaceae bacterium]